MLSTKEQVRHTISGINQILQLIWPQFGRDGGRISGKSYQQLINLKHVLVLVLSAMVTCHCYAQTDRISGRPLFR
eukprot:12437639-Heterocapsa_arctica.AAC.1